MDLMIEKLSFGIKNKSVYVFWLRSGNKISGRVIVLDEVYVTVDVVGEMAEFQNYHALIRLSEVISIAWVVDKE